MYRPVNRVAATPTSGSVCVVMTSILYDPDEYIRDYEEFKRIAAAQKEDQR